MHVCMCVIFTSQVYGSVKSGLNSFTFSAVQSYVLPVLTEGSTAWRNLKLTVNLNEKFDDCLRNMLCKIFVVFARIKILINLIENSSDQVHLAHVTVLSRSNIKIMVPHRRKL